MPNKCTNPMCAFTYDRRNRPEICPKCSVFLGPVKENNAKEKRKKKVAVQNPKHVTVDLGGGIYSVQYHQHSRFIKQLFYFLLKKSWQVHCKNWGGGRNTFLWPKEMYWDTEVQHQEPQAVLMCSHPEGACRFRKWSYCAYVRHSMILFVFK